MKGRVLGIYGMARIGPAVAERARALGMEIDYCKLHRLPPETMQSSMEMLMNYSRSVPFSRCTPHAQHFLSSRTIELLPKGAIVVDAARGRLVDDEALIAALKTGHRGRGT